MKHTPKIYCIDEMTYQYKDGAGLAPKSYLEMYLMICNNV